MWEYLLSSSREGCHLWASHHTPSQATGVLTFLVESGNGNSQPCCEQTGLWFFPLLSAFLLPEGWVSHGVIAAGIMKAHPAWHPLWAGMPSHPASWENHPGQLHMWLPALPQELHLASGPQFPHLSNKKHNLPHPPLASTLFLKRVRGEPHLNFSCSGLVIVLIALQIEPV